MCLVFTVHMFACVCSGAAGWPVGSPRCRPEDGVFTGASPRCCCCRRHCPALVRLVPQERQLETGFAAADLPPSSGVACLSRRGTRRALKTVSVTAQSPGHQQQQHHHHRVDAVLSGTWFRQQQRFITCSPTGSRCQLRKSKEKNRKGRGQTSCPPPHNTVLPSDWSVVRSVSQSRKIVGCYTKESTFDFFFYLFIF